jgi:4-hydroxybenzoate polyprenyltransferase
MLKAYIKLIRVKHWVKNFFVFLPAFFAGKPENLLSADTFLMFFAFCLGASSIYIINDIVDVEKDKLHPVKKKRPIASGKISVRQALVLFVIVLLIWSVILYFLHSAALFVLSYFIINVFYSFRLKNISILDVTSISIGFVLRVWGGGAVMDIEISHWMTIMVFLLSISMAFAKRRDDLLIDVEKTSIRKSLSGYTIPFLDIAKSISFSITLIAYILYSISPEVTERLGTDKLYITSLFVFCGIMRYIQISVVDKKAGSPVDLLLKDRFTQITILLWTLSLSIIIYGKHLFS